MYNLILDPKIEIHIISFGLHWKFSTIFYTKKLHSNTKPLKNAKMSGNGIPPIFARETGSSKFAGSRESGRRDPAGNKHYSWPAGISAKNRRKGKSRQLQRTSGFGFHCKKSHFTVYYEIKLEIVHIGISQHKSTLQFTSVFFQIHFWIEIQKHKIMKTWQCNNQMSEFTWITLDKYLRIPKWD